MTRLLGRGARSAWPRDRHDGGVGQRALVVATTLLALLLLARTAGAHPVPFSYLDLRLESGAIEGTLVAHIFDVAHDLNIEKPEQLLDAAFAAQQEVAFATLIAGRLQVTADGRVLTPSWSTPEPLPDRQSVRMRFRLPVDHMPGAVAVSARLFPYDPAHQTFLNLYEGSELTQAILNDRNPRFEYFAGTRQGVMAVVGRFTSEGLRHILAGPDHLLFLVGLLLLGGSLRQFVLMATAFTLANGVTLAMAAFGYVGTPPRIIEPALALTLVYVGADNLLVRGGRDMRIWMAVAFGCMHGLGYANLLKGMGLQARAVTWSLLPFGMGIEAGQLVVVVVGAAAFAALRTRSELASRRLVFAGSVLVAATGTVLFIQRVFFPGGM